MKDFGYDISDFKDIDPLFGTMDDFVEMTTKAHELGNFGHILESRSFQSQI